MQQFVCIVQWTIIQTKGMYCILLILLWNILCMKGMYCILLRNIYSTSQITKIVVLDFVQFGTFWSYWPVIVMPFIKKCKIPQHPTYTRNHFLLQTNVDCLDANFYDLHTQNKANAGFPFKVMNAQFNLDRSHHRISRPLLQQLLSCWTIHGLKHEGACCVTPA